MNDKDLLAQELIDAKIMHDGLCIIKKLRYKLSIVDDSDLTDKVDCGCARRQVKAILDKYDDRNLKEIHKLRQQIIKLSEADSHASIGYKDINISYRDVETLSGAHTIPIYRDHLPIDIDF